MSAVAAAALPEQHAELVAVGLKLERPLLKSATIVALICGCTPAFSFTSVRLGAAWRTITGVPMRKVFQARAYAEARAGFERTLAAYADPVRDNILEAIEYLVGMADGVPDVGDWDGHEAWCMGWTNAWDAYQRAFQAHGSVAVTTLCARAVDTAIRTMMATGNPKSAMQAATALVYVEIPTAMAVAAQSIPMAWHNNARAACVAHAAEMCAAAPDTEAGPATPEADGLTSRQRRTLRRARDRALASPLKPVDLYGLVVNDPLWAGL